jgi:hypothetical protein
LTFSLKDNKNPVKLATQSYFGISFFSKISWNHSSQFDLKWTQHTNNIVVNANKSLGFLKRNLKTSNTNIKSQAYLSLVRPKLEYA